MTNARTATGVSGIETKAVDYAVEVKALTEEGEFEGLASTFGNVDEFGDLIMPGAFKGSIKNPRRIKLLWSHSMSEPIGIWKDLEETDKGLFAKGQLALGVQRGREAYELLKIGATDSLSIGFRVPKNGSSFENENRVLKKIDLLEISLVSVPANPKARIQSVKSADGDYASEREFERWLTRDAGLSRSEAIVVINDGYKALLAKRDAGGAGLEQVIAALRGASDRAATIMKR